MVRVYIYSMYIFLYLSWLKLRARVVRALGR